METLDINTEDEEFELLNSYKKSIKKNILLRIILNIFVLIFIINMCILITINGVNKSINNDENFKVLYGKNILSKVNILPDGFTYLDGKEGPITIDKNKDDGSKLNFYKLLSNEPVDTQFNKTKIAIIMFANRVQPNSIYENAISEIYQYSTIHGYDLLFNNLNYNKEKNLMYMKLSVIMEALVEGIKEKKYDWIFWADSDITIANPKIKLDVFLPEDDRINFLAASDGNGLNAGLFFLRVTPWSYELMSNALAYPDYHKDDFIRFDEQTAINNLLSDESQTEHYVIVPRNWFNQYSGQKQQGNFLIHYPGTSKRDKSSKLIRQSINSNWINSENNENLRKKVLEYYKLPRNKQQYRGRFKYRTYKMNLYDYICKIFNL